MVTRSHGNFLRDCVVCLIDVFGRLFVIILIVTVVTMPGTAGFASSAPRMRPYTGIGLAVFSQPDNASPQDFQLQLYEEPGLSRMGTLDRSTGFGNEWVFGLSKSSLPLIVSARKGEWLRVVYDDAGREAWIDPQHTGHFYSWEQFLKQQTARLLPGLQAQYYQLLQQPGGKLLVTLTPKQVFKVLKLDNAWGMVLTGQTQIGWLRWRDDDGRLLVGLDQ